MLSADTLHTLLAVLIPTVELIGILTAIHAIMNARTSQSAIARAISLVTFPWLAIALHAVFGRNKFKGYVFLRSARDVDIRHFKDEERIEASAKKFIKVVRLNFEISVLNFDPDFVQAVENMLSRDFSRSPLAESSDYTRKSFFFRFAVRSARLLAPIL